MSAKLTVKRASKEYSPADNANVLRIEFMVEDEEGVKQFDQGFPLGTTKDEMKAELKKFLDTFLTEKEQKIQNEALDKAEAETDVTIKELENYTVSSDGGEQVAEKVEEAVTPVEAVSNTDQMSETPVKATVEKPGEATVETPVEEKPV